MTNFLYILVDEATAGSFDEGSKLNSGNRGRNRKAFKRQDTPRIGNALSSDQILSLSKTYIFLCLYECILKRTLFHERSIYFQNMHFVHRRRY